MSWRLAGIERAAAEPSLPFFIEWAPGTPLPGSAHAAHRAGPVGLAQLRLVGDADHLTAWLGGHRLPVTVGPGAPGVGRIVLSCGTGEIVLDGDQL